jgi:hypothetical protein
MQRRNVVGVNTRYGYRTCELYQGDITQIDREVDVIAVSAFAGDYVPTPGTVIQALRDRLGIDVALLGQHPQFDFRESLGVWISRPLTDAMFSRLVCADIVGSTIPFAEVLENVFVALSLLEAKHVPTRVVALPVLGGGYQALPIAATVEQLILATRRFLERSPTAESVLFVEIDERKAMDLADGMDAVLGRLNALLPPGQLVESVRADLTNTFGEAHSLFEPEAGGVRQDWLVLLQSSEVRASELGVLGRKLVELLVRRIDPSANGPLHSQIRALENSGLVAPWICGYMHVLRHLGNEAAHAGSVGDRLPPFVEQTDLGLSLLCVERLLRVWVQFAKGGRAV